MIFPRPYTNFSQRDVLVESFHEGTPISNYLDDGDCDEIKLQGKLARIGVKTILQMVILFSRESSLHTNEVIARRF